MGLITTCIGAYPKPDYVTLPDWFQNLDTQDPTSGWAEALETMGDEASVILEKGTREAVMDQVDAGIDIPTDGEIARENYIHYHCRHLENIDFIQLTERQVRTGNYSAKLPTVRGPVKPKDLFLTNDWIRAQKVTDQPVKITMPGPLTVADTLVDNYYGDLNKFGRDIAAALNQEVRCNRSSSVGWATAFLGGISPCSSISTTRSHCPSSSGLKSPVNASVRVSTWWRERNSEP